MRVNKTRMVIIAAVSVLATSCGGSGGSTNSNTSDGDVDSESVPDPLVNVALEDGTIFFEDFDDQVVTAGGAVLNFTDFLTFDVIEGDVDLISSGANGYGVDCVGGTGGCIDLDGTGGSNPAGVLVSKDIAFATGDYILRFTSSGNQRGRGEDFFSVSLEPYLTEQIFENISPNEDFSVKEFLFTVGNAGTGNIRFTQFGQADQFGVVIDDIYVLRAQD